MSATNSSSNNQVLSWTPGNQYHGDLSEIAVRGFAAQSINKPAASSSVSGFSWNALAVSAHSHSHSHSHLHSHSVAQAPIQGGWGFDFTKPQGTDSFVWKGPGPSPALAPAPVYQSPFYFGR